MNRRTWLIVVVLLLLVVGLSSWQQRRSARSTIKIMPPTGQELALPPLQPIAPVVIAQAPAVEAAMDAAAARARQFWGNQGYTTKDRQSTHLSDAQRQALKAEWLSGSP